MTVGVTNWYMLHKAKADGETRCTYLMMTLDKEGQSTRHHSIMGTRHSHLDEVHGRWVVYLQSPSHAESEPVV